VTAGQDHSSSDLVAASMSAAGSIRSATLALSAAHLEREEHQLDEPRRRHHRPFNRASGREPASDHLRHLRDTALASDRIGTRRQCDPHFKQ